MPRGPTAGEAPGSRSGGPVRVTVQAPLFEPNRFINDLDGTVVATSHGSPWRYDTHVPVVFAGAGIDAQRISRPVETVDIAPTLSMLFGAKPPSGSVGVALAEVIDAATRP